MFMPARKLRPRAATMTEFLVILSLVAVACLIVVTVFGRQVAALFKRSTQAIATGSVAASNPEPGGMMTNTPYVGMGSGGHVQSDTGSVVLIPGDISRFNALTAGGGFTAAELNTVQNLFFSLPPAFQNIPLAGIRRHPGPFPGIAFFSPGNNTTNLPDNVFGGIGDLQRNITDIGGDGSRITPERIFYHEMAHALHHNDPALVQSFLDLSHAGKIANQAVVQGKLDAVNNKLAQNQADRAAGTITEAEFKARRNAFLAEESRIMEAAGFPSRFPGDTHSFDNQQEYFAIMAEMYRYEPARFQQMVANGTVTAAEAKWFADHNSTFQ